MNDFEEEELKDAIGKSPDVVTVYVDSLITDQMCLGILHMNLSTAHRYIRPNQTVSETVEVSSDYHFTNKHTDCTSTFSSKWTGFQK